MAFIENVYQFFRGGTLGAANRAGIVRNTAHDLHLLVDELNAFVAGIRDGVGPNDFSRAASLISRIERLAKQLDAII